MDADKTSSQTSPTKHVESYGRQSDLPNYEKIKKRIIDIVAKHLGIESKDINADAPLSEQKVAADEIDVVEILMNIEDAFNVEIKEFDDGAKVKVFLAPYPLKNLQILFMKKENKGIKGASNSNVIGTEQVPDSQRFRREPDIASARPLLILLLVLNAVVLLGQIYPEGAPPFARAVNIVFLVISLAYFVNTLWRVRRSR